MGLCRVIKQLINVHKDMEEFRSGRIFYQDRDASKAKLLLRLGYIKPSTTRIGTMNKGVVDLHHYRATPKGRIYERLFF